MFVRLWFSLFFSSFLVLYLVFVSSCGIKRNLTFDCSAKNAEIPLFLEFPQNDLVFENVAPLIYDVFMGHFERIGYNLVVKSTNGYTLRVIIRSLDPIYKYVSPDVVLFHATIKLELLVQLLNFKKDMIAQKTFLFTSLISKPQNPILKSDFLDFEYTRLLKKAAPKVEQFFRPFLLKDRD